MGGLILIDKICSRCNILYKGIHNQQLCTKCKTDGFDRVCKGCNLNFISPYRYTTYCDTCKIDQVWKKGKFPDRAKNISKNKLKFYQTDAGKKVAKHVGKINSKKMKEYLATEIGKESLINRSKKISMIMKEKILNGKFTPKITNTFTHWNAFIETETEIRKFRSSWEACIWYCNQHWLYEYIRIPYINSKNIQSIYIVDFFDKTTNTLYEIKPKSRIKENDLKLNAAKEYCKKHNFNFILITENNLLNYINIHIFTDNNKKQLDKCLNKKKINCL